MRGTRMTVMDWLGLMLLAFLVLPIATARPNSYG